VIILKEATVRGDDKNYHFIRLRSDGVELDSLNITTSLQGFINTIEILHNSEGDAAFSIMGKLLHCETWESESEAQATSFLSKHYTARIGLRTGNKQDGLRIFDNLRQSIPDTYLKHLLGIFPNKKSKIFFDDSLYRISTHLNGKEEIPEKRLDTPVGSTSTIEIIRKNFMFRNKFAQVGLTVITLLLFCGAFLLLRNQNQFHELPTKLKQLMQTDLLPVLPMLGKDIETLLLEFRHSTAANPNIYFKKEKSLSYKTLDSFLDQIFFQDKEAQVLLLHNSVILNDKVSDFKKAEALRRLYQDNLTSIIKMTKPEQVYLVYDYLLHQENKGTLIQYLFLLITKFPDSALAQEALLIYANIIEIQQHLAGLLFDAAHLADLCTVISPENMDDIKQRFVCLNYKKYHRWKSTMRVDWEKQFSELRLQALSYRGRDRVSQYRINDIKFEKACLLMGTAKNSDEWLRGKISLDSISMPDNGSGFIYRGVYAKLVALMRNNAEKITTVAMRAKDERLLVEKQLEMDEIQRRLSNRQSDFASLKTLGTQAWIEFKQKAVQEKITREDKLSRNQSK